MNDFNTELCRTCLRRDGSVQSIFAESSDLSQISLAEIIYTSVPSVHITKNDGFSHKICTFCAQKFLDFHQFILEVERNQITLKAGNINEIGTYNMYVQDLKNISSKEVLLIDEKDYIEKEEDLSSSSSLNLEELHYEVIIEELQQKQEKEKNISKSDSNVEDTTTDNDIEQEVDLSSLDQEQENTGSNSEDEVMTEELISEHDLSMKKTSIENDIQQSK